MICAYRTWEKEPSVPPASPLTPPASPTPQATPAQSPSPQASCACDKTSRHWTQMACPSLHVAFPPRHADFAVQHFVTHVSGGRLSGAGRYCRLDVPGLVCTSVCLRTDTSALSSLGTTIHRAMCTGPVVDVIAYISYKHRKVDIAGHGASLAIFKWLFFKQLSNNFL